MTSQDIKPSKYDEEGTYFVQGQTWQVGKRYKLRRVLGTGSFSCVCLADDSERGEEVAVKRIADVLSSPEQAKRVLREVCILRRLSHPFIIELIDAFVRPSAQGPCKLRGGKLVSSSLDVYIVTSYADGGDLFHFRGQLLAEDVQLLTWQMLHVLKYLHANNVWHRDIKSANVLTTTQSGQRILKVADFGSARSATHEGYADAAQPAPQDVPPTTLGGRPPPSPQQAPGRRGVQAVDSFSGLPGSEAEQVQARDLYVRAGDAQGTGPSGIMAPLTCVVATPCYRAPEVVMSRGGYSSGIDMWSLGCILGELLQRVAKIGSASTPRLQVAPMFAITGKPKTPSNGEVFAARDGRPGRPDHSTTRTELQALFDVIGTPHWTDVDAVQSPAWRHYLQRLPGKAPTLYRRLGSAGEPAVHLLSRLLAFDPSRRCTAEEALAHEYLCGVEEAEAADVAPADEPGSQQVLIEASPSYAAAPAIAEALAEQGGSKRARRTAVSGLKTAVEEAEQLAAHRARLSASGSFDGSSVLGLAGRRTTSSLEVDDVEMQEAPDAPTPMPQHYYEEPDPAKALAMLEREMATITAGCASNRSSEGCERLRRLLEHECEAQAQSTPVTSPAQAAMQRSASHDSLRAATPGRSRNGVLSAWGRRDASAGTGGDAAWHAEWTGLQEDINSLREMDPADYARARLSNVADTWKGTLDPGRYLNPGRHGEWTSTSGSGPAPGPTWGVSMMPPGMQVRDSHMLDVIRSQQLR